MPSAGLNKCAVWRHGDKGALVHSFHRPYRYLRFFGFGFGGDAGCIGDHKQGRKAELERRPPQGELIRAARFARQ